MSEAGCLRDGFFNRIQVETGDIQDAFPNGTGTFKGLVIDENQNVDMGGNRVKNIAYVPQGDNDAASKYYIDSVFPSELLSWINDSPPQNVGVNTSPQFVNLIINPGKLKLRDSTYTGEVADNGNGRQMLLGHVQPTAPRAVNIADASGTLIPFDTPSTTVISSTPEELNILHGITTSTTELNRLTGLTSSATQLNYINVTPGTASATKSLVVDANKDIQSIRNVSKFSRRRN